MPLDLGERDKLQSPRRVAVARGPDRQRRLRRGADQNDDRPSRGEVDVREPADLGSDRDGQRDRHQNRRLRDSKSPERDRDHEMGSGRHRVHSSSAGRRSGAVRRHDGSFRLP